MFKAMDDGRLKNEPLTDDFSAPSLIRCNDPCARPVLVYVVGQLLFPSFTAVPDEGIE